MKANALDTAVIKAYLVAISVHRVRSKSENPSIH